MAAQSVLRSGDWYKFSVDQNGVYKITYNQLKKTGIDVSAIDPRNIKIFGNTGGMLPQANSEERPDDLTELSIYVVGEDDGTFKSGDYILFYAEGPNVTTYQTARNAFFYENNLYSDYNYYFLTIGSDRGNRITEAAALSGTYPTVTDFNDLAYYELDQYNLLTSGREWFGEKFDATTEYTITWDLDGVVDNSPVRIVSDVVARSYSGGATFELSYNGNAIAEQYVASVSNSTYAQKGRHTKDTIDTDAGTIGAANTSSQQITYEYVKSGSGTSVGYLDFVLINLQRKLSLYGDQTLFRSASSLENSVSTFQIGNASSDISVWDITTPSTPQKQTLTRSGSTASFSTASTTLKEFVAFNGDPLIPEFIEQISNQDLHSITPPNLLIITNSLFYDEATRLAQHRSEHNGWDVVVVTVDQIYNEFSSGRQDVTAIRDFTKYLYDKNPETLKALLLMGRGSYDYKDKLSNNTNYVPTYESRNSLHPLETYSSDDYFGFLEDDEGTWGEETPEAHTLDIGVGRLPVKTAEEASYVVDKIIQYETGDTYGRWRKQIVFVADDGDNNIHQTQADQLSTLVENSNPEYDIEKIYLDAYEQVSSASGETAPDVNAAIEEALNQGAFIVNYTGHGGEKLWAQERIFDDYTIVDLTNENLPLFVTATCEFGRQDDPSQISSAELCVLKESSGAIAMVSTARPVNSSTNYELNKAFYNVVFTREDDTPLTLGEIFKQTKNNSLSGVSNRNFSLIGDPSLTLAFPQSDIYVTNVSTETTTDTLEALSHVTISGSVTNEEMETLTDFSGILEAEVFDKKTSFTTLGNEDDPTVTYTQWDNTLFRGQAEVIDGSFSFEFIVPKNISYQLGTGRISLYAYDETQATDASGSSTDFVVGGSNTDAASDDVAPVVSLFMGDTTFRSGGTVSPSTQMVAYITDDSGITISGYGIGNDVIGILDNDETYTLNDYYEADVGDYTSGWIYYPLNGLSAGRHTLVVKVWDTYNNPGEASIDFIVTDSENLTIETFGNYPNPFSDQTTLYFTHNSSGDDLLAQVSIMDMTGKILKTKEITIYSSNYRVELVKFGVDDDFGQILKPGLYFARLVVRSLTDGSKNERVAKLIMVN